MGLVSNEYTRLTKGDSELFIKPNIVFTEIPAGYTVHSSAFIFNDDKTELLYKLQPGDVTPHIKDTPSLDLSSLSASELRELCIEKGLSFPKKATKTKLIEMLSC